VTRLEGFRAGAIDAKGYAEGNVESALSHVHGVSAAERAAIREVLRARLQSPDELGWLFDRAIT
jgi:hypothetical protein